MNSIFHKITIESSPDAVFEALSTESGLSSWWTKAKQEGDNITFYFGPNGEHQVVMKQLPADSDHEVKWQCIAGPWETKGEFVFLIQKDDRGASLDFAHHGWQEADDFYKHCNAKWGFFLAVSLKRYLETGKGQPHPEDPNI